MPRIRLAASRISATVVTSIAASAAASGRFGVTNAGQGEQFLLQGLLPLLVKECRAVAGNKDRIDDQVAHAVCSQFFCHEPAPPPHPRASRS